MSARPDQEETVRATQTKLLYGQLTIALMATAVNAVILCVVLASTISLRTLLIWLVCTETVVLLRYGLLHKFRKRPTNQDVTGNWDRWFITGTLLAGLCWGSTGLFHFPEEAMLYQMFVFFVLGGMTAGAVAAYSARIEVFLAFIGPCLLPAIVRLLSNGDKVHLAMGAMGTVFFVLMIDSARRMNKGIVTSLRLEIDNRKLFDRLAAEKTRIEKLNEDLRIEITERKQIAEELKAAKDHMEDRVEERTAELKEALAHVRRLSGLLPICAACKKIRDDQGYWTQLETYLRDHSEAEFTHSLCPECYKNFIAGI
jgi:hypothetical protein